jgi:hypothetical protein
MGIFDYGYLVTTAFSQTRHIAPSLRLFVPNCITQYNNPSVLDVSVVQSSMVVDLQLLPLFFRGSVLAVVDLQLLPLFFRGSVLAVVDLQMFPLLPP